MFHFFKRDYLKTERWTSQYWWGDWKPIETYFARWENWKCL